MLYNVHYDIIRRFLKKATSNKRRELEELLAGGHIVKKVNQELTYRDFYKNLVNLWSVLFMTRYLTKKGKEGAPMYPLVIPNREIRQIYIAQIREWFQAGWDEGRFEIIRNLS